MLILHIGLQWGGQGKAKTTRNAGRIVGALGIHFFFFLFFYILTNVYLYIYIGVLFHIATERPETTEKGPNKQQGCDGGSETA
jgi:uncharacterized BrkB/YihY/UPF0761 family membrane protein